MKTTPLSVLCLSSLLLHVDVSFARIRIGGGFGKVKLPPPIRGTGITNTGVKSSRGSGSLGGYPRQPGGYPLQAGRPGYPGAARSGGYGGYPGGYINHNPSNKVLSPRYGGSFGYGGYGVGGGSPYAQSVQAMGAYPSDRSRGFGHSGVMAAAGGAMAGMALGYGLGRFPRPHFSFHSPQEEYYYNHYMYRKYGVRSTDSNDYSRDYKYAQPPMTYDSFMDSCVKTTDALPAENQRPKGSSALGSNTTGAESSEAPSPPPVEAASDTGDNDTVSIVEIGYPALIEQLKARRCLELYMVYSEKYLDRVSGGAQRLDGSLAIVTSTFLTLVLLH